MSSLFNKICSVSIGPENSEGIKLSGLRVVFSINKSTKAEENHAKITLTNLSKESINYIEKDQVIILKAGYEEDTGERILFSGYISNFYTDYSSKPDIHTIIEAIDGSKKLEESDLSICYEGNMTIKQILKDLSKKIRSPEILDLSKLPILTNKTLNGLSFVGEIRYLLDYLGKSAGFEWSIQNGSLKICALGSSNTQVVTHISPESGLIGSPERMLDITKSKKDGEIPGWKVKTLLLPGIEPGNPISIESRDISKGSIFKVYSIEHSGDTDGNDWTTSLKVETLSTNKTSVDIDINFEHSEERLV